MKVILNNLGQNKQRQRIIALKIQSTFKKIRQIFKKVKKHCYSRRCFYNTYLIDILTSLYTISNNKNKN